VTIGIAVHGVMAGLATFKALQAVERVGRGAIGGFASFVAISADGQLLRAETQRGGTSTLFTAGEATGVAPPALYAEAPFAAVMSSGPDRPAPLCQFVPGRPGVGLVSGHRLPNSPNAAGVPLNRAVLERMARGEPAPEAAQAELARNPDADAGIIALDCAGRIFAGNSEAVDRRPDIGRAVRRAPDGGAAVAVLHNTIHPAAPLAVLAAAIALDVVAPADRPDIWVRLDAGTPVELGAENCVVVDRTNVARRVTVTDPAWLIGRRDGALVGLAAAVRCGEELLGHAMAEPYGVVEAGRIVSLSGAPRAEIGVRLRRPA
jgi:Domain of unknown function (DUF6963)